MKLTADQLTILPRVRAWYGKAWKQRLGFMWSSGLYPTFSSQDDIAALQQLRNQLGPGWLAAYRPGDEQSAWLHRARFEVPYAGGYRWKNGWKIAHADGKDMIQPYCGTKSEARQLARDLKITLIEDTV